MATFMVTTFMPMYTAMAGFEIPFERWLVTIIANFGIFFSGFWLLLQMYFPRPSPLIRRRPWLCYGVTILPWALLIVVALVLRWIGMVTMEKSHGLNIFVYGLSAVQVLAGLVLLIWNYLHAETYLEKRQTKLVLWGSGGGLVLFLIYLLERYAILHDVYRLPLVTHMLATDVVFLILLLSPLSLAYAFGRYRLLEIEGRLRRGTRHIFTLALLLLLLFGIGYYASEIISQKLARGSFWNLAVTIVVVVGILRGAQTVEKKLERRFYPERQRLRQMIHDFLQRAGSLGDKQLFWNQLEERLRDSLAVEDVYPVLRGSDNGHFLLRDDLPTPFCESSALGAQNGTRLPADYGGRGDIGSADSDGRR